jgi:hypothetical protein
MGILLEAASRASDGTKITCAMARHELKQQADGKARIQTLRGAASGYRACAQLYMMRDDKGCSGGGGGGGGLPRCRNCVW